MRRSFVIFFLQKHSQFLYIVIYVCKLYILGMIILRISSICDARVMLMSFITTETSVDRDDDDDDDDDGVPFQSPRNDFLVFSPEDGKDC